MSAILGIISGRRARCQIHEAFQISQALEETNGGCRLTGGDVWPRPEHRCFFRRWHCGYAALPYQSIIEPNLARVLWLAKNRRLLLGGNADHSPRVCGQPKKHAVEKGRSKDMNALPIVSRRSSRKSQGVALLSTELGLTIRRSAAPSVTRQVKEQKNIPVPDTDAQTELKHIRLDRFFPGATEVGVAGSFNGWQPAATPMERFGIGCGQRKVDLYLKPGRYEYRFVADGNWTDDPFGGAFVANPFGTRNSVLVVSGGEDPQNSAANSRAAIPDHNFKHASTFSSKGLEQNLGWADSSNSTDVQRRKEIEELAYELYQKRGKEPGHALEDWLEAEKRLRYRVAAQESYRLELGHGP